MSTICLAVAVIGPDDRAVMGDGDQPRRQVAEGEDRPLGLLRHRLHRPQRRAIGCWRWRSPRSRVVDRFLREHIRAPTARRHRARQERRAWCRRPGPACCSIEGARRQQPDQADGAGDGEHLRRRTGTGLPEQQGEAPRRPEARRRGCAAGAASRARAVQASTPQPMQAGNRQAEDGGRRAPAVAVDRPRLAHMAEPQIVEFGRNAFQPRQAMRPGERVESGDGGPGDGRRAQPRTATSAGDRRPGRAARRRRARHRTARPATRRRRSARRLALEANSRKPRPVPPARVAA